MNMSSMAQAALIAFATFGIVVENHNETDESLEFYISVPEDSYHCDADEKTMAGMHLANRFKQSLIDMGVKRLTVKARIRKGEYWTKEKSKEAELDIKKMIYGSQY